MDKVTFQFKSKHLCIDYEKLSLFVIALLDISNMCFVLNVLNLGYVPIFTASADAVRGVFTTTPFFSVVNITRIAYVFIYPALKNIKSRQKKLHIIISALIGVFFVIFTGYRNYLFQISMLVFASIRVEKSFHHKNLRKFAIFGFLFFTIVLLIRSNNAIDSVANILDTGFRYIYLYIYPNFTNFQIAIETVKPRGDFLYTTEMFWNIFYKHTDVLVDSSLDLYSGFGTFNVGTYMLQPYGDYGLFGTLLWTTLIAILASTSYKSYSKWSGLISLTFLGIANEVIFSMHNGFLLRSSSFVIYIFIAIFLERTCRLKSSSAN